MRTSSIAGLLLCSAITGLAQAPQAQPPGQTPEVLEERAYVRRFSAGLTLSITPFPPMAADQMGETSAGPPAVELRSDVDANSRPFSYGAVLQVALTERLALAVQPTIKKVDTHTLLQRFEGTDNSSTSFDDRDKTETDEIITARHIDIPILLRLYSKDRHERGGRWFFEGGPVMRTTQKARVARRIFPPEGGEIKENVPFPHKNGAFGVTAGIGGQLIDDFGIRAVPEVRYTRWVTKAFDSLEGRTRSSQIEFVFSLSF
jgi:hypothetical protein